MTDEPTVVEVGKTMGEDLYKAGKLTVRGLRSMVKDAVYINTFPYMLPTSIRKISEFLNEEVEVSEGVIILGGGIIGTGLGFIGLYYQSCFYWNNPKYLLALLGTNAASALYEWGRNAKKRAAAKKKDLVDLVQEKPDVIPDVRDTTEGYNQNPEVIIIAKKRIDTIVDEDKK